MGATEEFARFEEDGGHAGHRDDDSGQDGGAGAHEDRDDGDGHGGGSKGIQVLGMMIGDGTLRLGEGGAWGLPEMSNEQCRLKHKRIKSK